MGGFNSTSLDLEISIEFALKADRGPGKTPVLMQIQWKHDYGHFRLNSSKYSAMPEEKEVLLIDGAEFIIMDVISDFEVTYDN